MLLTDEMKRKYYQALMDKNPEYEGKLYVGVTTTGVFCRPTCPTKNPKLENCEFFKTAKEALDHSYRPCKRCRPLFHPNHPSDLVLTLAEAIAANPEKRWTERDLKELSIDTSTARRQFKKRFGMTLIEYARNKRIGLALEQIKGGEMVIDAQLNVGYESSSGFRSAFSKITGSSPTDFNNQPKILNSTWIDTALGTMLAISDEQKLYLLDFIDRVKLGCLIEEVRTSMKAIIIPGTTDIIKSIEAELKQYFDGKLKEFKTPLQFIGSPFLTSAWEALLQVPYGKTISYAEQASIVGRPKSYRAIANANGANKLSIIVPCHRIINSNGELGGYGGGIIRKRRLIELEKNNI